MSQNPSNSKAFFRELSDKDLPSICAIEKQVYEDPWSERLLADSLKANLTYSMGTFATPQSHEVIAYGIYQVIYSDGHLLNLAVAPEFQGQGKGEELLDQILVDAHRRGALSFFLEVRPSNARARKLYEKKGFRLLLVRDNYYPNGEAALILVLDLVPHFHREL